MEVRARFLKLSNTAYCFGEILRGTGMMHAEMYFGDCREVDGIRLPFSITESMAQMSLVFTVEGVKHNVPLADALFAGPRNDKQCLP